jgi:hypothetical protein
MLRSPLSSPLRSPLSSPLAARRGGGAAYNPVAVFGSDLVTWYGNSVDGLWRDQAAGGPVTLYQDNLGTTPITALEQTVGLILDKSRGLELGPELVTNGDFGSGAVGWTLGANWAISGGVATLTSGEGTADSLALSSFDGGPLGRAHIVSIDVVSATGPITLSMSRAGSSAVFGAGSGTRQQIRFTTITGPGGFAISMAAGGSCVIDNISVRELPGHHLSQATAAARGRLSARYNTVNQTENLAHADWFREGGIDVVGQTITVLPGSTIARVVRQQGRLGTALGLHTATIEFSVVGHCRVVVGLTSQFVNAYVGTAIDSVSGEVVNTVNPNCTHINTSVENLGGGRFRVAVTGVRADASAQAWGAGLWIAGPTQNATYPQQAWDSAGEVTVTVHGIDCRLADYPASWPQYQRVTSASDYDTAGFPARLVMDGVDDRWVTGALSLGATLELTCIAAAQVRGTSGTHRIWSSGTTAEFSMYAPRGSSRVFLHGSNGYAETQSSVYGAPYTGIFTGLTKRDVLRNTLRVNGEQVAELVLGAVAGGHTDFALGVGGATNGAECLNGDIFSLPMIVKRLATPEEITAAEKAFGKAIGVLQ